MPRSYTPPRVKFANPGSAALRRMTQTIELPLFSGSDHITSIGHYSGVVQVRKDLKHNPPATTFRSRVYETSGSVMIAASTLPASASFRKQVTTGTLSVPVSSSSHEVTRRNAWLSGTEEIEYFPPVVEAVANGRFENGTQTTLFTFSDGSTARGFDSWIYSPSYGPSLSMPMSASIQNHPNIPPFVGAGNNFLRLGPHPYDSNVAIISVESSPAITVPPSATLSFYLRTTFSVVTSSNFAQMVMRDPLTGGTNLLSVGPLSTSTDWTLYSFDVSAYVNRVVVLDFEMWVLSSASAYGTFDVDSVSMIGTGTVSLSGRSNYAPYYPGTLGISYLQWNPEKSNLYYPKRNKYMLAAAAATATGSVSDIYYPIDTTYNSVQRTNYSGIVSNRTTGIIDDPDLNFDDYAVFTRIYPSGALGIELRDSGTYPPPWYLGTGSLSIRSNTNPNSWLPSNGSRHVPYIPDSSGTIISVFDAEQIDAQASEEIFRATVGVQTPVSQAGDIRSVLSRDRYAKTTVQRWEEKDAELAEGPTGSFFQVGPFVGPVK